MSFRSIGRRILSYINVLFPKFNQVIVEGGPNIESNAIAVANYISQHYDIPVFYVISNKKNDDPRKLLSPGISTLKLIGGRWPSINYLLRYLTSRFIFLTHKSFLDYFSDRQTVINIWHGVLYKNVRLLDKGLPIPADITVGTSQSTKKMFSEAFGVSEDSVYVSGYPRNDMLLKAKKNKNQLRRNINGFDNFKKIAIWLPTYRKNPLREQDDGNEVGNPFYISDFNISNFNKILKSGNCLCLVKPHPNAPDYQGYQNLSNVRIIEDKWITNQGLTLYQLLGCTDFLISDVSSVIIDYMLLDQPIICVSTDFNEYRKSRGFYFDDIENRIPSRINRNQESFFRHIDNILQNDADPSEQKRKELKSYFFDNYKSCSTEKLVKYALDPN